MKQATVSTMLHGITLGIKTTASKQLNRIKAVLNSEEIQKTLLFGIILALLLVAANLDTILK